MKVLFTWIIVLAITNVHAQEFTFNIKFIETVELINKRLALYSENGNPVRIIGLENGNIIVTNNAKQTLRFNLFDLKKETSKYDNGIEIDTCNKKAHVPSSWINFKSVGGTIGFIRLSCNTAGNELENLRKDFLQLKELCSKSLIVPNVPYEAMYFVSRGANITTQNITLLKSIRAVDTLAMDEAITSFGEGWLDKDSIPFGKWNFYAKDKEGKMYLFKSGHYLKTKNDMFTVKGIDSITLFKNYNTSFKNLKDMHVQTVPFIKTKAWSFYYSTGKQIKTIYYKSTDIPIDVSIVMIDMDNMENTRLIINLKEDKMDEWAEE